MFSIKLSFNNEFRRMAVPTFNGKPKISMDELVAISRRGYNSIANNEVSLLWTDEDGDTITVSSNEELQFALACMMEQSATVFKFIVDISKSEVGQGSIPLQQAQSTQRKSLAGNSLNQQANLAIHANVTCDECGLSPIVGIRYKCAVRNDFDLCEQCEGRKAQPYPMIKIYDPEQAPVAIMIAVRDRDDDLHRGLPVAGCHGPPHARGPHHGRNRPWGGQGPHGKHAVPVHGPPNCGGRKWERTGCPWRSKSAFSNAFEEFINSSAVESKPPKSDEMQVIEQTLVEEAVRASLEEFNADIAPRSVSSDSSTSSISSVSAAKGCCEVSSGTKLNENEAVALANPVPGPLTKSAMRFIRDVTFPDGSKIQPGTVFSKIWKVRNDGDSVWPEGTVLTTAGGDHLTAVQLKESVSQAQPGEEVEIRVTLTAPRNTGRYVAYFRLQNANGVNFGHRLWADIVVEEEDPTWAVVSSMTLDSTLKATDSTINSAVSSVVLPDSAAEEIEPAKSESVLGTVVSVQDRKADAVETSISVADFATNVWSRVWAAELEVLSQMGFVDTKALIPLLKEHVSVPVSMAAPGGKGVPNADGMQRVVMHLLGQSI